MSTEEHGYRRDQVVEIINSVVTRIEHVGGDATATGIFQELKALQNIIEEARADIGMTRPGDIKDKHIPTATDELDAVVEATAEATGTIMDACDKIQEVANAAGGDVSNEIEIEVTKVYEACSFQDITGQRITKVVSSLKQIDEKVSALINVLGEKLPVDQLSSEGEEAKTLEESLLNGPQSADKAISQDEIDKLLEMFDD